MHKMPPDRDEPDRRQEAETGTSSTHVPAGSLENSMDETKRQHPASTDNDDAEVVRTSSAQEIFQASLTFESSHQNMTSPPELERHASAGGTLYPTLASVSAIDNNLDPNVVEDNWEAAARLSLLPSITNDPSSLRASQVSLSAVESDHSAVAVQAGTGPQSATPSVYDGVASIATSDCEAKIDESIVDGTAVYPPAGNASIGNNSNGWAASVRYQETTAEDDDLVALKRAAAYGGYDIGTVSATVGLHDQQAEATVVEYDVHPSELMGDGVHAELIGHDFSGAVEPTHQDASPPVASAAAAASPPSDAYEVVEDTAADHATEATVIESGPVADKATAEAWSSSLTEEARVLQDEVAADNVVDLDSKPPANNNYVSRSWPNSVEESIDGVAVADEEAEVVGITDHIHPSDVTEDAAQAELVGTDSNYAVAVASSPHQEVSMTPLDEGFIEQAATSSGQAEVVAYTDEEIGRSAARAAFVAVHPSNSSDESLNDGRLYQTTNGAAEVVDISEDYHYHPSEHTEDASARAELVGNGGEYAIPVGSESQPELIDRNVSYVEQPIAGTEAAVLGITEVEHNAAHAELVGVDADCNVAVSSTDYDNPSGADNGENIAVGDGAAEVVSITEEMHPSERVESVAAEAELIGTNSEYDVVADAGGRQTSSLGVGYVEQAIGNDQARVVDITEEYVEASGDAAEAEFIGTDAGCAVAVASDIRQNTECGNIASRYLEQATVIADGGSQTVIDSLVNDQTTRFEHNEVQATLVAEDSQAHSLSPQGATPVTTLLGESSTEMATPVTTVLQETYEDPGVSVNIRKSIEPSASTPCGVSMASTARAVSAPPSSGFDANHPNATDMRHTSEPVASLVDARSNTDPFGGVDEPPQIPGPSPPVACTSSASRRSDGSQRSGGFQALSNNIVRSTNSVMELLFGESKPNLRRPPVGFDMNSLSGSVLPRTLLPSSVIFSEATKSWVATVNTNQKALDCNNVEEGSRSLRAFSVPNKKQAMCLAVAWSPPRMHPFQGNPNCHICDVKFAVFRRACHCRNCGVCVCNSCSVQWPSKMVPATYNIKRESVVNICKACDWLCSAFRLSLLQGDHDKAVALHATGNINLTTPFANVKGELFYPVHCAVIGSNLKLLKWLVDDHCCPLRSIRISNGKQKDLSGSYTPILTSKGRSLLGIALENRNVGIIRYLVVEKRMLLSAEKDLSLETVIHNLDLVLRALPEEVLNEQTFGRGGDLVESGVSCSVPSPPIDRNAADVVAHASSAREHEFTGISARESDDDSSTTDACIICFSNSIDCVVTPCGHQICCLECSKNINRCPVCAVECSFMRVFKP